VWCVDGLEEVSGPSGSDRAPSPLLRSIYHAAPAKGRQIAIKVLESFHTCPIREVARLGRTLCAWKAQVLATLTPMASATAVHKP
jgi:hypothetical protein